MMTPSDRRIHLPEGSPLLRIALWYPDCEDRPERSGQKGLRSPDSPAFPTRTKPISGRLSFGQAPFFERAG